MPTDFWIQESFGIRRRLPVQKVATGDEENTQESAGTQIACA